MFGASVKARVCQHLADWGIICRHHSIVRITLFERKTAIFHYVKNTVFTYFKYSSCVLSLLNDESDDEAFSLVFSPLVFASFWWKHFPLKDNLFKVVQIACRHCLELHCMVIKSYVAHWELRGRLQGTSWQTVVPRSTGLCYYYISQAARSHLNHINSTWWSVWHDMNHVCNALQLPRRLETVCQVYCCPPVYCERRQQIEWYVPPVGIL